MKTGVKLDIYVQKTEAFVIQILVNYGIKKNRRKFI